MPPGNLPQHAKEIYTAAEANAKKTTCKGEKDVDACAARVAWGAVKEKYEKVGDTWKPKAELQEFSMAITKTSYDKATDTRRWNAVASDTVADLYNDNMTQELYSDFLHRIETKEEPPESLRSDFWSGGMPYLSVSHYPDFNGKAVPGPVDAIYVDGKMLKGQGRFDDTLIGREAFKSISKDMQDNIPADKRIRISIAFLDWKHKHKSNGFVFDRSESKDPICPECLKEIISGEYKGKEFLRGQLVHLALTRVPVNTRTSMEVRSMTTRKEDAASIIGDELADELDEEALLEGKSLASDGIVIKAEDEDEEELVEESKHNMKDDEEDDTEEEDKKKKKDEMKSDLVEEAKKDEKPKGEYGDVAYADTKNKKYPIDTEEHIRAAWNYINMPRNQKSYSSSEVSSIKSKIIAAWKKKIDKEGPPSAKKAEIEDITLEDQVQELISLLKSEVVESQPIHPLDIAFSELKAVYDEAIALSNAQEALQLIQEPFEALGAVIQNGLTKEDEADPVETDESSLIAESLSALREEIGLLHAEIATLRSQPQNVVPNNQPPQPRNFKMPSNLFLGPQEEKKSETPGLRAIARRSVGL